MGARCNDLWRHAMARRIGLSGMIDFTQVAVGQTLHIPCARGHRVDMNINKSMPPDFVAKKMMQQGWTIGSKLLCPKHSRKAKKTPVETTNEERIIMPDTKTHTAVAPPPAPAVDLPPPSVTVKAPTPAAGKAKRLVYLALEDHYDENAKRYKPGHSDKSISTALGVAEAVVRTIREESYGPLGAPPEFEVYRDDLKSLRALINEQAEAARNEVYKMEQRLATLERKFG